MKGSAVREGWNAIAAKLHPKVPLSTKESHNLVNTLNRSFRKHLDEIHPLNASENAASKYPTPASKKTGSPPTQAGSRVRYTSSANQTDQLLASVLANPLLARGITLDSKTATEALKAGEKPGALFRRYRKNAAASLDIAALCLTHSDTLGQSLTSEENLQRVTSEKLGTQILNWLRSDPTAFLDAVLHWKALRLLLVKYVMKEGQEEALWDLLEMPVGSLTDGRRPAPMRLWNTNLARLIIQRKLLDGPNDRADEALVAFMRLLDLLRRRNLPIAREGLYLLFTLKVHPTSWQMTDPVLYERFVEHVRTSRDRLRERFDAAALLLLHRDRTRSDPFPMYETLKIILRLPSNEFTSLCDKEAHRASRSIEDWISCEEIYKFLVLTLRDLEQRGDSKRAQWLLTHGKTYFDTLTAGERLRENLAPSLQQDSQKRVKTESEPTSETDFGGSMPWPV